VNVGSALLLAAALALFALGIGVALGTALAARLAARKVRRLAEEGRGITISQMLSRIAAMSPMGIVVVDAFRDVVYMNDQASELGLVRDRLLDDRAWQAVQRCLSTGADVDIDLSPRKRQKSGRSGLSVRGHVRLLVEEDHQFAVVFVGDQSEQARMEATRRDFVANVSHELKTPVALIKGYVSTLRRDDVTWDSGIVQESLQVIEEEADRLSLLIENLLDASRLQSGGLALKRTDISIPDMARRIAARMQTQTEKHTILLSFPQDFPVIVADEQRLEQVLSNLIGNAIKYSAGGEITVSGQVRPDVVIVCVSDQGPGIAPQDIPHIFDRFYRGPDMARQTKGAGLGLYLTRSIVEAHGGRIWVDPESGKGARICFTLPRNPELKSSLQMV
jgi:two-component system sensor histidine kinase SenX3